MTPQEIQDKLGWIRFEDRTKEQDALHDAIVAQMPAYARAPQPVPPVGTKVLLTDTWKHPLIVKGLGYEYTGSHQITGSCVWAGAQNVGCTLNFIEVLLKGDLDQVMIPFMLPNYGKSRQYGGMNGTGEGSFGSTMAKSAQIDGSSDARAPGRPPFTRTDGFIWGRATEMKYSNGAAISQAELDEGRKHLFNVVTPLRSAAEVRDAILNGDPVTRAFDYFCNPGTAKVKNGKLVGSYNGNGGHQESWLGYFHDVDGEWIWEQNQWGLDVYGNDPAGGPRGGVWMSFDSVDSMIKRNGTEIYSYSMWTGYQVQKLDWLI